MTLEQLQQIIPTAGANAGVFYDALVAAMAEFWINTKSRRSMFIPQVAHESGAFASVSENLNYKPTAILVTFNTSKVKRFTADQAEAYGRTADHAADQPMIANIAYANRNGNGDIDSGDGWRYRGAGLIQTTFANNHRAVAGHFGIPPEQIGDWLRTPEGATRSAAFFWSHNRLNELADAGDFVGVCAVVNTGNRHTPAERINGFQDRLAYYERARQVLVEPT